MPQDERLRLVLELADKDFRKSIAEDQRIYKEFMRQANQSHKDAQARAEKVTAIERTPMHERSAVQKKDLAGLKLQEKLLKDQEKALRSQAGWVQRRLKDTQKQLVRTYKLMHAMKLSRDLTKEEVIILRKKLELSKQLEKVYKKSNTAQKKRESQEAETTKKKRKFQARYYGVVSRRGVRMIATMRGSLGFAVTALASLAQTFIQTVAAGMRQLVEYEKISMRIGMIKPGGFTAGYKGAMGSYTYGAGGLGTEWVEAGLSRLTGAKVEILALQSGLEWTNEQLIQIGKNSYTAGVEAEEFFANLIMFVKGFNVEAEDMDDAIAMFTMVSARTTGGAPALLQQLAPMKGVAEKGGWDWKELLAVHDKMVASGADTVEFWNELSAIIQKVTEDDALLDDSIRGLDNKLVSFADTMFLIDQHLDNMGDTYEEEQWIIKNFGEEALDTILAIRGFTDETTNSSSLIKEKDDLQKEANDNQEAFNDTFEDSVIPTIEKFKNAVGSAQMAIAELLLPIITELATTITWAINMVTLGLTGPKPSPGAVEALGIEEGAKAFAWVADAMKNPPEGLTRGQLASYQSELRRKEGESEAEYWTRMAGKMGSYSSDRDQYWHPIREHHESLLDVDEEEDVAEPGLSPPTRVGGSRRISTSPGRKAARGGGSVSHVTHNYITVQDNDKMIRDLIRVNLSV